jgi:hypothetical protein
VWETIFFKHSPFWQVNIARKGAGKPSTVKSSLLGSKKSLIPLLHLQQLKTLLIDEGELILETLIIDKKHGKQIIHHYVP